MAESLSSGLMATAPATIVDELSTYAQNEATDATAGKNQRSYPHPRCHTRYHTPGPSVLPSVAIIPCYRPGILARTLEMHLEYYYPRNGWGLEFEAVLATGLGDLLKRLNRPVNQVWSAVLTTPAQEPLTPPAERIVGVVYVDGECSGEEGVARLRCFIVDESARGMGVGKKLFGAAMEFVTAAGFRECRLTTQRSLVVATRVYEGFGFEEAGETWFDTFGKGALELKYV